MGSIANAMLFCLTISSELICRNNATFLGYRYDLIVKSEISNLMDGRRIFFDKHKTLLLYITFYRSTNGHLIEALTAEGIEFLVIRIRVRRHADELSASGWYTIALI